MDHPDLPEKSGRSCWRIIELVALAVGFAGSATACLASYNWHWNKESLFFMSWSALPFALTLIYGYIAGRLVKSRALRPVTALLAVAMTGLSLMAYVGAVLHPNHSSGMVFAYLPICWMIAIPVVLTVVVVFFLAVENWRRP